MHKARRKRQIRNHLREVLGPKYSQRLGAVFAVLHDEAGVLALLVPHRNVAQSVEEVAAVLRQLRDEGDLKF